MDPLLFSNERTRMKKKIKIALIDSGINDRFNSQVIEGISIIYDEKKKQVSFSDDYTDENGHGTYCAQIINSYCPFVEFVIIKILDKNNRGYSQALTAALEYLLQFPVDIINLSLAVLQGELNEKISKLCARLKNNGVIINVSVANRELTSFPASLRSTIGIRGAFNIDKHKIWFNEKIEIQCVANIIPVLVYNHESAKTFFGGNSKATALVTGLIANTMYNSKIVGEELFKELAARTKWDENDIQKEFQSPEIKYSQELKSFSELVCDLLQLNSSERNKILEISLFPPALKLETEQYIYLIECLAEIYHKNVIPGQFELTEMSNIYTIYNFFNGDK